MLMHQWIVMKSWCNCQRQKAIYLAVNCKFMRTINCVAFNRFSCELHAHVTTSACSEKFFLLFTKHLKVENENLSEFFIGAFACRKPNNEFQFLFAQLSRSWTYMCTARGRLIILIFHVSFLLCNCWWSWWRIVFFEWKCILLFLVWVIELRQSIFRPRLIAVNQPKYHQRLTLKSFSFWYQISSSSCTKESKFKSSLERERIFRLDTISLSLLKVAVESFDLVSGGPRLEKRTRL